MLFVVVGGQEPDDGDEDVDRAHDRVCGLLVPVHCLLHLVGEIIEQVQNTWIPTEDEVRERVREGARADVDYTKASHYKKNKGGNKRNILNGKGANRKKILQSCIFCKKQVHCKENSHKCL